MSNQTKIEEIKKETKVNANKMDMLYYTVLPWISFINNLKKRNKNIEQFIIFFVIIKNNFYETTDQVQNWGR